MKYYIAVINSENLALWGPYYAHFSSNGTLKLRRRITNVNLAMPYLSKSRQLGES
jgi:hypothetical protein